MAKILLAEDNASMRDFLGEALRREGHEVVACADGEEGLEAFEQAPETFDLILTSIVMPGIDGIEMARLCAEIGQGLRIMFITGFSAVTLAPDDSPPSEARVLSKPFHLSELVREVNAVCGA